MRALGWVLLAVGIVAAVYCVVRGFAAPTTDRTWGWAVLEVPAVVAAGAGLHLIIDPRD